MDSHTGLQNPVQSPPQEQAQINPPHDDPSPAPPTIPEVTGNQRPPPSSDTTDVDARAQKKRRIAEIRALASAYLLDLPSLASNTRFSSQHDIWART
jgi:hypothetical protein